MCCSVISLNDSFFLPTSLLSLTHVTCTLTEHFIRNACAPADSSDIRTSELKRTQKDAENKKHLVSCSHADQDGADREATVTQITTLN